MYSTYTLALLGLLAFIQHSTTEVVQSPIKPLDIVSPAMCGSQVGQFVRLEVTSCPRQPCPMTATRYYEVTPSFAPVVLTNNLRYVLNFIPIGESTIHLKDILHPGTFSAGRTYRIAEEFQVPTSIRGKQGKLEVVLKDGWNTFVDQCFNVSVAAA